VIFRNGQSAQSCLTCSSATDAVLDVSRAGPRACASTSAAR
jgi:hypothetical protein